MEFEISNIGIVAAITAGAISFLSPCVLPLVPGYVSFIAGSSSAMGGDAARRSRLSTTLLSVCFVLGFTTVFVALGASATAISGILRAYSYEAGIVGGLVVVVFGIFTTGLVQMPWLQRDVRYHGQTGGGFLGSYLLGLAFAFGWTPCIGPILGSILTVSAVSATATDGIALLSLYSLGLGVPFVLAALFTRSLTAGLPKFRRAGRILQVVAGIIMIVMGLAMMTGTMTSFAFWLLDKFPAFGSIG